MNYLGKKRDVILEASDKVPQFVKTDYEKFIKLKGFMDESSLRRIVLNQDFYDLLVLTNHASSNKSLLVLMSKTQNKELVINSINKYLQALYYSKLETLDAYQHNLWWNTQDDYIMFFDSPEKIFEILSKLKNKYVSKKFSPVFKSQYENQYEKLIFNRSLLTFIKDYKCDFKNQIHYVEFLKGSRIDKVLMEVLLISKLNLGKVMFNINEEDMIIDATYSLNEILMTYGLRLDYVCFSTKTIEQLENEFTQKQEASKKLCHLLKQVSNNKN